MRNLSRFLATTKEEAKASFPALLGNWSDDDDDEDEDDGLFLF